MTGNNSQACYLARLQSPDFRVTYNFAAAWFSKVKFLFMNILTDKEISIFRSEKDNKIISVKQLVNNRWQSTGAYVFSSFFNHEIWNSIQLINSRVLQLRGSSFEI